MKKFFLISPKNRTVYNFRGDLIRDIRKKGYEVYVTGPDTENIAEIESLGVRFIEIPMNKTGLNPFADLQYFIRLYKLLKKEKPDVILGYTIKPVIYGGIAAKLAGVSNINSMITGTGYLFTSTSLKARIIKRIASLFYKVGLQCADQVIFQNPDDKNEFIQYQLVNREKCCLVSGSGVNMEKFKREKLPERITFFMLSRILYSKGVREYLEAVKIVKEKHPEVRCMLLGAVENLQDSMKMEDLQPYIDASILEYYGETKDVRAYIKQCSVYVLPSYKEGTPRTVLEAMSMGRAILTTDTSGCRETVKDGETGFLVPVKDAEALAEKMIWFAEHPQEIVIKGNNSYIYCSERFDVQKVNETMLRIMKIE